MQSGEISDLDNIVINMTKKIAHRGPDDCGSWTDVSAGIALGHRRLSIIDLSNAGHQPMLSKSGRFVIVFNGEIYNHLELRTELESQYYNNSKKLMAWGGHSDTETLLAGFETWGIENTINKAVGMFAIALWDTTKRKLHLLRDRFGEKPLYYGWTGRGAGRAFVFGSELKAFREYPNFDNQVCRQSLSQYMRFMYVPAPRSIYKDIYKLEAGCILNIAAEQITPPPEQPLRPPFVSGSLSVSRWWSLLRTIEIGEKNLLSNEAEALKMLELQLEESVRLQSSADVPVGAFLSGGVDSSVIVALMQKQATRPVKTFTVGFEESEFDESPHALAVANYLGTQHTELFVTALETQEVITHLPDIYDEPFADSSQIPTYLVSRAARQHVKVVLSGDGGDELFGGYNRYFWGPRIWAKLAWMPYQVRQALGKAICAFPISGWNALSSSTNALRSDASKISMSGDKAHRLGSRLLKVRNLDDLYLSLVSEWQDPAQVVRGFRGEIIKEPESSLADALPIEGLADSKLQMMYRDTMTYLPDDILCKVDRASMAVSLETRVPFLDYRVAELAWQLPINMKIKGNTGKWALRQILYKYVPQQLIDRPKAGFAIPVGQWLRGPLKPWAENLLNKSRLENQGYFYPAPILQKWAEHISCKRDHTASLWAVLMFQAWLENNTGTS